MEMNEMLVKAKKAKTPEELLAIANENGVELDEEGAKAYFEQLNQSTGELSDDELDEKMESIAELAEEIECLDILVGDTPTMKREFWAAHDAFHTSMESGAKNAIEYNITVPAEKIAAYGSTDAVVPALAIEILPVGLTGLALAGILSVIMSTADSYLIVSVQTCVHDIYKVFRPDTPERPTGGRASWTSWAGAGRRTLSNTTRPISATA